TRAPRARRSSPGTGLRAARAPRSGSRSKASRRRLLRARHAGAGRVAHEMIGVSEREVDREQAARDRQRRDGYHEPHPGIVVPGLVLAYGVHQGFSVGPRKRLSSLTRMSLPSIDSRWKSTTWPPAACSCGTVTETGSVYTDSGATVNVASGCTSIPSMPVTRRRYSCGALCLFTTRTV